MAESLASTLHEDSVDTLVDYAKDWAHSHGVCIRLKDRSSDSDVMQFAPFTLMPSKVSKRLFDQAYAVQEDMNLLYHRVSFDYEFISSSLASVVASDEFTRKLMEIYDVVHMSGAMIQPAVLTIQRADYMFHTDGDDVSLKQVEVNNIASSFAALDTRVRDMHADILRNLGRNQDVKQVPTNQALLTVARGLAEAWTYYNSNTACVLFIVEEVNRNVIDQRLIEYETIRLSNYQIRILRLTLRECFEKLYLTVNGKLMAKENHDEIAVVYFRSGYVPEHYPSDIEWRARLMLEQSAAVKCPWIGAHLAGTKKIQQMLTDVDVLKRYVDEPVRLKRILDTFVGLYGLEKKSPKTEAMVAEACDNFDQYVLKPQLEGGGNNFYGKYVKEKLRSMNPDEREAYILMDRIRPVVHENYLVRANQPVVLSKVVSEFGAFGYLLGSFSRVLLNKSGGHLLRTKPANIDEGGVMAGASVLDSPYLI